MEIDDTIWTLKYESSLYCHLNWDGLESESPTIQFQTPNRLSLPLCDVSFMNGFLPRNVKPVSCWQVSHVGLYPPSHRPEHVVSMEQGTQCYGVQVDGLNEVGQQCTLNAKNVPTGELIWKIKRRSMLCELQS